MIKPSALKAAYKKVEEENYAFRIYLKAHADLKKLDQQFLTLHQELFKDYDCNQCRNCCKLYSGNFSEEELNPVANYLNMTRTKFMDTYIDETQGYNVKSTPCSFLKKDGRCEIEDVKPNSCKKYPFTDQPERLFSLLSLVQSTSVCPVVFEMFDRLKKTYHYKKRSR